MRKLLFLLFTAFATFAILNCSADDDMPCLSCEDPFPPYVYCLVDFYGYYTCEYMSGYECYINNYNEAGRPDEYLLSHSYYNNDATCGGYWWLGQSPDYCSSGPSTYGCPYIIGEIKNWVTFSTGQRLYNISLISSIEDKISGQPMQQSSGLSDQFEPPVPYPENARIFDSDGDGIGDSLVIAYNRGFAPDSLPNMIEVQWGSDITLYFGIGRSKQTSDGMVYEKPEDAANLTYWAPYICNGGCGAGRFLTAAELSTRRYFSLADMKELRDTIILRGKFSRDVLYW